MKLHDFKLLLIKELNKSNIIEYADEIDMFNDIIIEHEVCNGIREINAEIVVKLEEWLYKLFLLWPTDCDWRFEGGWYSEIELYPVKEEEVTYIDYKKSGDEIILDFDY